MNSQDLPVIGWVEPVDLPEFGLFDVPAKIDSGAFSGALHCAFEHITEDENGEKWLEYQPLHSEKTIRTRDFERTTFYSSNGTSQERHIIKTKIIIKGQEYPITISLTDRSKMTYDIILGRSFLANRFMINPSLTNGRIESEMQ